MILCILLITSCSERVLTEQEKEEIFIIKNSCGKSGFKFLEGSIEQFELAPNLPFPTDVNRLWTDSN